MSASGIAFGVTLTAAIRTKARCRLHCCPCCIPHQSMVTMKERLVPGPRGFNSRAKGAQGGLRERQRHSFLCHVYRGNQEEGAVYGDAVVAIAVEHVVEDLRALFAVGRVDAVRIGRQQRRLRPVPDLARERRAKITARDAARRISVTAEHAQAPVDAQHSRLPGLQSQRDSAREERADIAVHAAAWRQLQLLGMCACTCHKSIAPHFARDTPGAAVQYFKRTNITSGPTYSPHGMGDQLRQLAHLSKVVLKDAESKKQKLPDMCCRTPRTTTLRLEATVNAMPVWRLPRSCDVQPRTRLPTTHFVTPG